MHIRKATIEDLNTIVKLRKQQLIDEGSNPIIDIDHDLETFFTNVITDESLFQLLTIEDEEVIATGAIIYYPFPPSYINQSGERAYVTNIYTHPNFRGRGLAQQIISLLIKDAEARNIKKYF